MLSDNGSLDLAEGQAAPGAMEMLYYDIIWYTVIYYAMIYYNIL